MTHQAPIAPGEPLDHAHEPRPGHRWTAPSMAAFLRMLFATHSVSAAARSVGMNRQSAYRLRSRLKGGAFDLARDVAFHHSYDNLAHAGRFEALNGVEVPIFFKGEQVGSYRKFDERLTVALLALSTQRGNVPLLGRLRSRGSSAAGIAMQARPAFRSRRNASGARRRFPCGNCRSAGPARPYAGGG